MARLGSVERSEFLAIRAACYRNLDSLALRRLVADRLSRYLRADAVCAMELDPDLTLPVHAVSDWPEDAKALLVNRALLASPTADPPRLLEQGRRSVVVDELLAGLDPERDPYFQFHLLPFGFRHEVQVLCSTGGRGRAFLTFTRRGGSGAFEPRHVRLLDAVAPHVAAGVEAADVRRRLASPGTCDAGVIVLDDRGRVDVADRVGSRWLSLGQTPMRLGWHMGLAVFASMVRRAVESDEPARVPAVELTDPESAATYRLRGERGLGADGRPRTIIILEPVPLGDRPEALLRLGLTPREADVALGLLRGEAVQETATRLRCSPHTVAQHRKKVFAKLSVSSRHELATRLMGRIWRPNQPRG